MTESTNEAKTASTIGQPHVAVIGAGAWGTTLAIVAARAGTPVTLVVRDQAVAAHMRDRREHPTSLAGVRIPDEVRIETDAHEGIANADVVLIVVPTQKLRSAIEPLAKSLQGKTLVCAAKGIEIGTLRLPHEIVRDVVGEGTPICALSGPNLSGEVARGLPATAVIASEDAAAAALGQRCLMGSLFRVYTGDDLIGVELGGALKNIIAIGAGVGDGLGAGDNAKAAFLTRGIAEISRLGIAHGAHPLTFAGLSGIGDLIATCSSSLSRNHHVGEELAKGRPLNEILAGMSEVAEGVDTTRAAMELAARHGVEMPIAEQIHAMLFDGKSPIDALMDLMQREPRRERFEGISN